MRSDYAASDFLKPSKFRTGYDVCEARAQQRYLDGLAECEDYSEIFICLNDTICATLKVGNGQSNGYEKLGYHAYTADYLRAILDSGCPVWVSRVDADGKITKTQIK
jgi:hypothetical protein